ncbi:GNAT family N-acetyltransferase [Rhabdobacter roseus]|uniref:Aminoglycoside 6'-N-acetyltransferase I n=1 Tax=Rhabdobacter roseus TaxID=1655419 RepID=A0A840TM07_9BACT|nr:GNAT family N-acetyltransferase [Rhabdobacter roseus]MBB5285266.1 aminoglycoside 6'-N-acetyltransferase I [Rhabdobacter roseus]
MKEIEIIPLPDKEAAPFGLLLLADPSSERIQQYLPLSEVYVARFRQEVVGVYVLCPQEEGLVEIKNLAVKEKYQGKGVGQALLQHAIQKAQSQGFREISIGTANSSVGQLYLYQKMGFEMTSLRKNFFIENYPHPLYEHGLLVKHMIMLTRYLS